ncbi:unnamed protein product [Parascedosporium putredinis]|uniref:Uncharacterized protein n=1 Tax=Parascedosporium putredinis TaxID=1442378 RepID=A0A9P1GU86_9PEZI|nr:unnamed protein product [Parascedosporium putredinis]CAI7987739.1 unnamed protein product [Parascedosporium putredinis]
MAGPRKGDTTKRNAGLAKKAEVAAQKAAVQAARDEAAEEENGGLAPRAVVKVRQSLPTPHRLGATREVEDEKKADQARKKAEREALLAAEEQSLPGRSTPKKSKAAVKKTRGPDLSQLDDLDSNRSLPSLNASGIDNALDALTLPPAPPMTPRSSATRKGDTPPPTPNTRSAALPRWSRTAQGPACD